MWTDAYDKVSKQLDDLEVLNEFHEAGDVSEDELDREYLVAAKAIEELEFKKMLSHEEDQLSAVMEINPGAGGNRKPGLGRHAQSHVHHVGRKERL